MQFTSINFLIFYIVLILVYFIVPNKFKYVWMLVCSLAFYAAFGHGYIFYLIGTTAVTYIASRLIGRINDNEDISQDIKSARKKQILIVTVLLCVIQLSVFKYAQLNMMMPIGLSFYSFAVIGYLADVYKGTIKAERNIAKYALFTSFFAYIVSGPIERYGHFMNQIEEMEEHRIWNYHKFVSGFIMLMWGAFLKMVLADRMSAFVDVIFDNYASYGTIMLFGGMVAYSIQIYADFAGYSLMAIGSAKMMGIELFENFNTPYFARNIKDFWARWHMSLSGWLKDYVYIPLGGSRCSKVRNYLNLMITFLISGAWHGNGLNFVFWGFLHGAYQVMSKLTYPMRSRIREAIHVKEDSKLLIVWQMSWTFVMATIAWVFFRVPTMLDGFKMIGRMATQFDLSLILTSGIHDVGFDNRDVLALLIAFVLLFAVSIYKYNKKESPAELLMRCPVPFRMAAVLVLIFLVLIFGEYGPGAYSAPFVYAQF